MNFQKRLGYSLTAVVFMFVLAVVLLHHSPKHTHSSSPQPSVSLAPTTTNTAGVVVLQPASASGSTNAVTQNSVQQKLTTFLTTYYHQGADDTQATYDQSVEALVSSPTILSHLDLTIAPVGSTTECTVGMITEQVVPGHSDETYATAPVVVTTQTQDGHEITQSLMTDSLWQNQAGNWVMLTFGDNSAGSTS